MPTLVIPEGYTKMPDWWVWTSTSSVSVSEGWKLHVGGTENTAQLIADKVGKALRKLDINHKFARDTWALSTACTNRRNLGKWNAIYPSTIIEAFIALDAVDRKLSALGYTHNNVVTIATDKPVGSSCVFARYGGYEFDYVLHNGELTAYDPESAYKPAWIEDPWLQFKPLSDTPGTTIPQGFTTAFPNMNKRQRVKLVRAAGKEVK
jgi:hypothetical protein